MIKSKILYGLCIAALGLPFADAMEGRHIVGTSDETTKYRYSCKLGNHTIFIYNNDSLEQNDKRGIKRHASQDEYPKKKDNSKSVENPFRSPSNSERERPTNTLNSQIKNSQQLDALSQPVYDLTEDLRNEPTKNAQSVEPSSEYVENMINLSTYLTAYGGTYDEIKATLEKIFKESIVEKYTPSMYEQMMEEFGSYDLWFLDTDSLEGLFTEQGKESIRKELLGYNTTKKKAKKLLKAIDNPSYDENEREKLESELQALGVCRRSAEYGDKLLKIQLDAFLNPHKHKYKKWPRNDYNEIVWKAEKDDYLTAKEQKGLNYLVSVCGDDNEIATTFKNVFMRDLTTEAVQQHQKKQKLSTEKTYKGVFCEEDFNQTATTLKLTEFEKNRLIRSIRGYKENIKKLAAFLLKGGYEHKEISSIFKILYNKTYWSQTISSWKKEKSSPEGLSSEQPKVPLGIFDISPENLAKEINTLWTYQTSVDSEKDREKCEIVKSLLTQYNDETSAKKCPLKYIYECKINRQKLFAFLVNGGFEYKDILSIFKSLYNKEEYLKIIAGWLHSLLYNDKSIQKLSNIFGIHQKYLAKYLYNLGFYKEFVERRVDVNLRKRFKKLLENCGIKVQEDNSAVDGMEFEQETTTNSQSFGSLQMTENFSNNKSIEITQNQNIEYLDDSETEECDFEHL